MKKTTQTDLRKLSKDLNTKVHKTDSGLAEFVRFRGSTVKGLIHTDGSGGLSLKIPGLDCFTSSGRVLEQIEELEKTIAAYIALKPDLKRLKQALKRSETVIPEKGKRDVKRSVKKSS